MERHRTRLLYITGFWAFVAAAGFAIGRAFPESHRLPSGLGWLELIGLLAATLGLSGLLSLVTHVLFARKGKPAVEGVMVGRLYWLLGILAAICAVVYGFNLLGTFGTLFSLFGGMLLGWSLQAPVSGFAAWALVSLKRPFRPGDRVQFPGLGLTGDIKEIGPMYAVLNQVGGSIASEEAVGRDILVPNAMLFGQVVINYTVSQEAAYMLDEVVVRITYDSDWRRAEHVLLNAAREVTKDVIAVTGEEPYIRADLYDYGVYMRLRYQTRVKDRAETSYKINKLIFEEVQKTPAVDIAIPYVYSYRAGQDRKGEEGNGDVKPQAVGELDVERVFHERGACDSQEVERLARSISIQGLLQPILVTPRPGTEGYDILAGHMRFEACRSLGWRKVPAVIQGVPPKQGGAVVRDESGLGAAIPSEATELREGTGTAVEGGVWRPGHEIFMNAGDSHAKDRTLCDGAR